MHAWADSIGSSNSNGGSGSSSSGGLGSSSSSSGGGDAFAAVVLVAHATGVQAAVLEAVLRSRARQHDESGGSGSSCIVSVEAVVGGSSVVIGG